MLFQLYGSSITELDGSTYGPTGALWLCSWSHCEPQPLRTVTAAMEAAASATVAGDSLTFSIFPLPYLVHVQMHMIVEYDGDQECCSQNPRTVGGDVQRG